MGVEAKVLVKVEVEGFVGSAEKEEERNGRGSG